MKNNARSTMQTPFPPLNYERTRAREFNYYDDNERSSVIYHWLVYGTSTREMDVKILGLNESSKGYQSHGIYRYLGLDRCHQGFFRGWSIADIVEYFHPLCIDPQLCAIFYYLYDYLTSHSLYADTPSVLEIKGNFPEEETKGQLWIDRVWMAQYNEHELLDTHLLSLPDIRDDGRGMVVTRGGDVYYSSAAVKSTVKNIYDFHCQVCGDVILRKGWRECLGRTASWKYLSADIHHILPLSKGGPDRRDNMICLCPTCHRKFHSGEFRLVGQTDSLTLSDELLGLKKPLYNLKHRIVIY